MKRKELPGVHDLRRCCSFTSDGKWMALLSRRSNQQDQISIFHSSTWDCAITFSVNTNQARNV